MPKNTTRVKRIRRRAIVIVVLLFLAVAAAPMIVAKTPLRNVLLASFIGDDNIQATTGSASFGWFSSLSVNNLRIVDKQQERRIVVAQVGADRSWVSILFGLPNLGHFQFERPFVDWMVTDQRVETAPSKSDTTFSATVHDAVVRIRHQKLAQPIVDLAAIDLSFRMVPGTNTRFFEIDPVQLLDRKPLTPELCSHGLQLVAPILADELDVDGEVSFDLTSFRVPVDIDDPLEAAPETDISGTVQLHRASVRLTNPLTANIAQLVANVLRLKKVPGELRVAENSQLRFHVRDGRVYHDSFSFVFPDISDQFWIESGGSVGLDESLDLTVTAKLPFAALGQGELARKLSDIPIVMRVTGTLDRPQLRLPEDQTWLTQLGTAVFSETLGDDDNDLADQIVDKLGDLVVRGLQRRKPRDEDKLQDEPDSGEAGAQADRPARLLLDLLRDRLRKGRDDK